MQQPRLSFGATARAATLRLLHRLGLGDHRAGVSSSGWLDLYWPTASMIQGRKSSNCLISGNRRSEEHTSELQSLMRISYAVFCLKKKTITTSITQSTPTTYTVYMLFSPFQQTIHQLTY